MKLLLPRISREDILVGGLEYLHGRGTARAPMIGVRQKAPICNSAPTQRPGIGGVGSDGFSVFAAPTFNPLPHNHQAQ